MDFKNLQNFVNEYLVKTEPNIYWKSIVGQTYVNKIEDAAKGEITLTNNIGDKSFIGRLGLNDFDLKLNKSGESLTLAEGEYEASDETFKNACRELDEIMNANVEIDEVYDMDLDRNITSQKYKYFNFPVEFLVSVNNNGKAYDIYPLYATEIILDETMKYIINRLKIIINFFANKHMYFSGLNFDDQKIIYIYIK